MTNEANPLDLSNRVVLITGGAQGIGEATAQLCAARGAQVVIADVKQDVGERAAAQIRENGGTADFFRTDVRDPVQVSALIDFTQQRHGRLDTLICAAGVLRLPYVQPEDFPLEEFAFSLDVNVIGPFLCAKYATPLLVDSKRGVIIIVASGAGVIGASSSLGYGSSKGGANGLGMTLGAHLSGRGVRVNVLCPGNIVTEMKLNVEIANAERSGASVDEALATAHQNYGTPMGVARVIGFMISDEADYVRGNVFTR